MLNIQKNVNADEMTFVLEGRLDTTTAPDLEAQIKDQLDGITKLTFDIEQLRYISSAGLRVLLSAQKVMNRQGTMVIRNVCPEVMEIFDVTGSSDILTIR